ncbi:hypothetical protein CUMW_261690 [Citrus unshiu]|uniref:Ubiquitin-like protease family profile domain-containing protein n=1 Tax=Citrus unshiu TaxID=55188 RepID=A0A2H5QU57_CITUN|nr:hypothetical protein CUMW_261690 [Citrus unshiu]
MVKFAMLYFLESVLLGKEPNNKIDNLHIRLLDNFKEFNNYPWGCLSFEVTMLSLKNTVTRRSKRIGSLDTNTEEKYNLYGFPFTFQWKQELGELNAVSGDEPNNEPNSAHSNVHMQQQVDVVMDDRHATITDDISHTPFYAPSPGFFPTPRDYVAPTFQKIYDRLSKIEEKVQKIDVLEAKLDNITKDLWRTIKLLEEFLASSNVGKDSLIDQQPAHDHQTAGTAHVDANKIDVEVYISLHPKQDHWALVEFDLQKEIIFVYDSILDYMNDNAFEKELLPFVVMMPLILNKISWYTSHSDDNSLTCKWKAVRLSDIPQQKNNNYCGVFVMFYLEALVNGLDIPYDVPTQAGINSYRKQVATMLFSDKKLIEEYN